MYSEEAKKTIRSIEERYGITLEQQDYMSMLRKNCYQLDDKGEVIALNLEGNNVTDITPLKELQNLRILNLSNNSKLSNMAPLKELKNLRFLYLVNNQINCITPLQELPNLRVLNLWDNQISDISPLRELINLEMLFLGNNHIRDILEIKELKNLTKLYLKNNQIKIFPEWLLDLNLDIKLKDDYDINKGIFLGDNPIEEPPLEIMSQGNEAIRRYFDDIRTQGRGTLNEAKLIIVGEPEAGKSTLMECLLDDAYLLDESKVSTIGIDVKSWIFSHPKDNERELTANIWDFGGQQIQYMTHQFFLSPDSVYLLVTANDRKESTNFDYWFKIINLLGENRGKYSPVIVIKNKIVIKDKLQDSFKFDFDELYYKAMYPHLTIEVKDIDLSNRRNDFNALKELVQDRLSELSIVNEPRPALQEYVRESLSKIEENHINYKQFVQFHHVIVA